MCHRVDPFVVPGQDTRPHLVALKRFHFLAERAADGAQGEPNQVLRHAQDSDTTSSIARIVNTLGEEKTHKMAAGDIQVCEIGAI